MNRPLALWPLLVLLVLSVAFVNVWMWDDDRLALGVPVNLLYHLVLCAVTSLVMAVVVRLAWPAGTHEDDEDSTEN